MTTIWRPCESTAASGGPYAHLLQRDRDISHLFKHCVKPDEVGLDRRSIRSNRGLDVLGLFSKVGEHLGHGRIAIQLELVHGSKFITRKRFKCGHESRSPVLRARNERMWSVG